MLKFEGLKSGTSVYNVQIYLGIISGSAWTRIYFAFGTCSLASILIDCIGERYTKLLLDWAGQVAIHNHGNSRGG